MNMELGIVLSDTPTYTDENEGGNFGDSVMDRFGDIFGKDMFKYDCAKDENLTYEERYA